MDNKADILLVTATEIESKTVLSQFKKVTKEKAKPHSIDGRVYFELGKINAASVFMTQSEMGSTGLDASLQTISKGIEALNPIGVIMVGIAFGINEAKQEIGDILVTEQLRLYDLQRIGSEGGIPKIILRGDKPHASPWLINHLKSANLLWEGAKVRFGTILSGEKLVDNLDFRNQLKALEQEAIGGEMEGAGMYVACFDKKVDWILIKGLCDWADGNKSEEKDARQQLAAQNAVEFVISSLKSIQIDWVSKRQGRTQGTLPLGNIGSLNGNLYINSSRFLETKPKIVQSTLPHLPYFFGREKELATIAEAIHPDARTWGALIDGPGGIGKTSLAIRAGHLAPTEHFSIKIFLSAKVRELTPLGERKLEDFMLPNFAILLSELARELGEDRIEQVELSERVKIIRLALTKVHALLIIDNLETFPENERVRLYQFLTQLPTSCKAIVTSRRRTDIDARIVRLDRLSRTEAFKLLDELAKKNRLLQKATELERSDLYEITNGNPLLIRWTIGQLGIEGSPYRTLSEAVQYLKAIPHHSHNDPLEYIFGDLIDSFTPNEINVLAALVHFNEPAKITWIANAAGIIEPAALTALEDLADRALLINNEYAQTFYLPTLAATFIRRKRPEIIAQTGKNLVSKAFALIIENGNQEYKKFPSLEENWTSISAAIPLFLMGISPVDNERLQNMCFALNTFLEFSGRWDEKLKLNLLAENIAVKFSDFQNAGFRAYNLGVIFNNREQNSEVQECITRCTSYWEKSPEAGLHEKTLIKWIQGSTYLSKDENKEAIEIFTEIKKIYESVDPENIDLSSVVNNIGRAELALKDYNSAKCNFKLALDLAEKLEDKPAIATFTCNLAFVESECGQLPAAEDLAIQAIQLSHEIGRQELIAGANAILAHILVQKGSPQEGIPFAQVAVDIYTKLRLLSSLKEAQEILEECEG
jgi:nucleoside phosphorylase/tetratricopeptide (TPR) repeat protein